MLDYNDNLAEVAFSVADEYQHQGIGTYLLRFLMRVARERGIRGFRANVLASNSGMLKVFQKSNCVLHTEYDTGEVELSFLFDDQVKAPNSEIADRFHRIACRTKKIRCPGAFKIRWR